MLFNRTHFNVFFKLDKRVLFILSEYLLYKIMCHIAAFSYVCIWLLCFVHACLHVYPCIHGGQRSTSGVDPQKSFILSLSQVFLSLGLTNYTRLACVPPAPGPGSQTCAPMYTFMPMYAFMWVVGIELKSSCSHTQRFTSWALIFAYF